MTITTFDHYVVLVSDHNLAELRACLYFKPHHVWLIATQRMQVEAQRFRQVLQSKLPQTDIHQIGDSAQMSLQGERANEVAAWLSASFALYTASWSDQRVALNVTGGTKILSMLISQAYPWDELHYQPFQSHAAQVWLDRLQRDADGQMQLQEPLDLTSQHVELTDAMRLYVNRLNQHTPNPIFKHPHSLALAQLRLDAQSMQQATLDNPWPALTSIFNRIWYENPTDQPQVHVEWSSLALDKNVLQDFCRRLNQLVAENEASAVLSWDEHGLNIPSLKFLHKPAKTNHAWQKWVSGDWYEQLIQQWLLDIGFNRQQWQAGVQLAKGESQGQETDILLMHRQQVHVLEIKSDLPQGKTLGEFEAQLSSSSEGLGKVTKVLIVSPHIKNRASHPTNNRWLEFEKRCRDARVQLMVASCAEDLKKELKIM